MGTVASLVVRVSALTGDFDKALTGVEKQWKRTGASLQSAGTAMTKGITLPLVAIGGLASKAAIEFESSFAGVKKTVNATTAEFAVMAQGMRNMAKEMPVSVNELNRIGEAAGQLGISKDNILEFTKVMAMLGATTNLTAEEAATSIAQVQNIFKASGQDTSNFASALVALGNAGASTEAQIVGMAARIAGAGQQVGLSQAQVLGLASAMANVGLEVEAGGTAISTVFKKMSVAVDTGGPKLAEFAKLAGLTTDAFKTLFKSNAAEAFTKVTEGLSGVKEAGGNVTLVLKELGLADIRVSDTMTRLAGNTENLRGSLELSQSAWMQNTALTEEYKKRAETTSAQLQILWNKVNDVAITLGTALLPTLLNVVGAMDPMIKMVEGMVSRFAALPVPVQAVAMGLGALLAAAGPVVYIAGTLISAWGSVAGLMSGTVVAGFTAVAAPIVTLIGLVGALALGMSKLSGAAENAMDAFRQNGWAGVWGELGRNVNNDDWSFGKSGRVDQARMGMGKGDIDLPGSGKGDIDLDALSKSADEAKRSYAGLGKAGADAMKGVAKEELKALDAMRAITTEVAIYTGLNLGGGVNTGASNLGGMMQQFRDTLPSATDGRLQNAANAAGMLGAPNVESLNVTQQVTEYAAEQMARSAKDTVDGIRSAFQYFTGSLSGGMAALLGGVMNILEDSAKPGGALQKFFGSKLGGMIGTGLNIGMAAFGGGTAMGEEFGRGKGALAGAGSGALSGFLAGGPIGAAIGGLAGLFGGLFGGGKKKREQQAKMAEARGELVDQFGGMEGLTDAATRAGVSLTTLFATDDAKVFQAELENVTSAIEVMQERIATTVGAIDQVMAEGGLIGRELWQSILTDGDAEEIKAKLAEVFDASVQRSAEGFTKIATNFELLKRPINEIGVLADAAFAGLLAGGASIPEAIAQMGDGLAHIQELMAKSGEGAQGPLAQLLSYQAISEAHAGLFELLSGVDDMITGLGNSGLLTQERFAALGTTITQAFGQLTSQGVAGTTALEMMQPQLQKLWEAQQTFGLETDAATQALLTQAEQQGLVGEAMKGVNSQILDVLKAIAEVLGAEIPGALGALPGMAQQAGQSFQTAFGNIRVGVGVDWNYGDMPQPTGPTGGTGTRPGASAGVIAPPVASYQPPVGDSLMSEDDWRETPTLRIDRVYGTVDKAFVESMAKVVQLGGRPATAWSGVR
jgi:TP901 family phage tail tape measure protein